MVDLWNSIAELAASTHEDRIAMAADAISTLTSVSEFDGIRQAFGPNADRDLVERFLISWKSEPAFSPKEVAAAFRTAARVASLMESRFALELVWTGPKTGLIPIRKTEQVILEVIESATREVFLMTEQIK